MAERIETSAPDELLGPSQAAAVLGISDRTLYRYEKRGLIHPMRTPGGHRRFRRADLEKLLRRAS